MNWALLENSLWLGLGTAALASAAAIVVLAASLLGSERTAGAIPLLAAANLLLPHFLTVAVWLDGLGYNGWTGGRGSQWLYTLGGASALLASLLWPVSFFFLWARRAAILTALERPDPFSGKLKLLGRAVWPQVRRPLLWGALLVFALAVNNLAVPGILQVRVLAEQVYMQFNLGQDLWLALSLSLPLLVVAFVISCGCFGQEFVAGATGSRTASLLLRHWGPGLRWGVMIGAGAVVALGLGLPFASLVVAPETWRDLPGAWRVSGRVLYYSAAIAALTATGAVVLGYLLRRTLDARYVVWLFLMPGTLIGAALAEANNRLGGGAAGPVGEWLPVFGMLILRYLALGIIGVTIALKTVDVRLTDLARLEGMPYLKRLWHCVLPSAGNGLGCVWWLIWLLCLWEVEVLIFVVPAGVETLALRVFNLIHYQHDGQVYASCLLLIALAMLPAACWYLGKAIARGTLKTGALGMALAVAVGCLGGAGCGADAASSGASSSQFFAKAETVGTKGTGVGEFNKPRSVVVGQDGDVYAVDMTGRVQRFDPQGEYLGFWQMPETERGRPKGMSKDALGNIIVVEPHYARVNRFSPDGELLRQWGRPGAAFGELSFPRAVASHSSGDLWVTEYQRVERVQRFGPEGKEWRLAFGNRGGGEGEFNRPEGIGVDGRDRVFVADSCNHRIQVFDDQGGFLFSYGRPGTELGELSYPYDVKIDREGYQFVCEFGNSRIQVFDPEHRPVEIYGGPGSAPGRFSNPWSLALDGEGNLWVADSGNHRLQKLVRRQTLAGFPAP